MRLALRVHRHLQTRGPNPWTCWLNCEVSYQRLQIVKAFMLLLLPVLSAVTLPCSPCFHAVITVLAVIPCRQCYRSPCFHAVTMVNAANASLHELAEYCCGLLIPELAFQWEDRHETHGTKDSMQTARDHTTHILYSLIDEPTKLALPTL